MFDGGLHRLTDGEVNLATVVMHRGEVARLLARTVAAGEYQVRPATIRSILVEGKRRDVFEYPMLDLVVHGVVADVLAEAIEPGLSSCLYSYRAGTSWLDGVRSVARYLRAHRRSRPDPRTRGVYVLRRDIDSYTDSIPLGEGSRIWSLLQTSITRRGDPLPTPTDQALIEAVVRPVVFTDDGAPATRLRGVATGQPISCVCFNVFLSELDRELDGIADGLYARYSDDLLFAHPDASVARYVSDLIDRRVAELGLGLNTEKRRDLYLTGAGRASVDWPEARGTTSVPFLGMRVTMDGTIALGHRKGRGLLRDARRRALNTATALREAEQKTRARAVVGVLNAMLDPDDTELHGSSAPLLARVVTDRRQLEQLDHQLARLVAASVSRVRPGAAFRRLPYGQVRRELGLVSLRRARDNGGRSRGRRAG
jgi:hypothetical protein